MIQHIEVVTIFRYGTVGSRACNVARAQVGRLGVSATSEGEGQVVSFRGRPYLWSLRLDLSSTRERTVDFTHDCGLYGSRLMILELFFVRGGGFCVASTLSARYSRLCNAHRQRFRQRRLEVELKESMALTITLR